jgi:hypothetical protein
MVACAFVLAPSGITFAQEAWTGPAPKASCGPGSRVESGIQGATTPAERFSGASKTAYNCNMEIIGQVNEEGTSWQMAYYKNCAYFDTTYNAPNQKAPGTAIVDVSDPTSPKIVGHLTTTVMLDPWESLHVNEPRGLLGGIEAENGTGIGGGFEVYDISKDCLNPELLSTIEIPDSKAHAGNWSRDGQFFYVTQGFRGVGATMPIVDVADPKNPKVVMTWKFAGNGRAHDTNTNDDGTRLYQPQPGYTTATVGSSSEGPEGLVILDSSDFAARKANPEMRIVGEMYWKDGGQAQQAFPVTIGDKPFVIFTQELGSGGGGDAGRIAACAEGLPPSGFVKIVNVEDETKPALAANVMLDVHDPKNCPLVLNEGTGSFGQSSHYCNVDNVHDARLLACSFFESGIRVFDIRDPYHPKEVAYYKGAARGNEVLPGSQMWNRSGQGVERTADWASSYIRILKRKDGNVELWFTTQENGFQVARLTNVDKIGADLLEVHDGDDVM